MRRALALGFLLAFAPPAHAGELDRAQKLPVDLPAVLIHGEDETAGPLLPGNKLAPDDPGAMAFTLPRPRTALDLGRYLAAASDSVTPGIQPATESFAPASLGYLAARLGASGPRRYELGLYGGRSEIPLLGKTWTGLGELEARLAQEAVSTAGDWSSLELHGEAATPTAGLQVQLGQRSTTLDPARGEAFAQALELSGHDRRDDWVYRADLDLGRVGTPQSDQGTDGERLALGASYHPEGTWTGHVVELSGSLGGQRTDRRLDAQVLFMASDLWELRPELSLFGSLGLGAIDQEPVVDPRLELRYLPAEATELSLAAMSETRVPTFAEIYLSRRYAAGNGNLMDEHVPLKLEAAASQRLDDRWYAHATISYAWASRWIAWRQLGDAPGLWQPFNPGYALDSGAMAQQVFSGELNAQYQPWGKGSQRFFYRWQAIQPLGAITQEAGTSHQSAWLGDTLLLDLGAKVRLEQLGETQIGGTSATGWQALVEGGLTYRIAANVSAYGRVDAFPLWQQQPAANYFAPDTLAVLGVTLGL